MVEANYEYELQSTAAARFPRSPSAGFELLRFGRVLGPDALDPPNAPHWRQVAYDGGTGWVDLNAASVKKFSDADFPSWNRWWMLIDASSSADSRCNDPAILGLLDADGDLKVSPAEWKQALSDPSLQERLSHKICNFPSEWDEATIDKRYGWLTRELVDDGKTKRPRLDAKRYEQFKAHVQALCFWQQGNIGIGPTHWHFHPRAFIAHFRKCGWLTASELAQLLPRNAAGATLKWADALNLAQTMGPQLNVAFRRYNLLNATRQIHFLAQAYAETGLSAMRENGRGNGHPYGPFYGRGVMQLTWPSAYSDYGTYRQIPKVAASYTYQDTRITHTSTHVWSAGGSAFKWYNRYDPEVVADDPFAQCDSAGFYWLTKNLGGGTHSLSRAADHGLTRQAVGDVCILINGGFNGFAERETYAAFLKRFRGDSAASTASATVTFTFRNTYVPPHATSTHTFTVNYTPQRP
jgi:hydroxyethylthiazole kinase